MKYRKILGGKRVFADWLVGLRDKSGVYVVRRGSSVLYVGESHTGNLAQTIRRHFQSWNDSSGRSHYTDDASTVEVGVVVLPASKVKDVEARLIRTLKPSENKQGVAATDDGSWSTIW